MDALRTFQSDAIQTLDTKAGVILGFSGTILAVFVTAAKADLTCLAINGFVLLAAAIVLGVLAMMPRDFRYNPKPSVLLNDYMLREPDAATNGAKEQILADKVKGYEENKVMLDQKAEQVKWSAICLGIGVLFLSAHILWRKSMANESPTTSNTVPSTAAPAPIAEPNPSASNTIKKGMGK